MRRVLLIALSLAIGFVFGYLQRQPPQVEHVYTDRVIWDTVYVDRLKPVRVEVPVKVPVPVDCDSLAMEYERLYVEHNSRLYYEDTLMIDTVGVVYLSEQLYRNRIDSLKYSYHITTQSVVVNTPKNEFRGIFYGGFLVGRHSISPMLFYGNKRHYFGVGYDVINQGIYFSAGVTIKSIKQ